MRHQLARSAGRGPCKGEGGRGLPGGLGRTRADSACQSIPALSSVRPMARGRPAPRHPDRCRAAPPPCPAGGRARASWHHLAPRQPRRWWMAGEATQAIRCPLRTPPAPPRAALAGAGRHPGGHERLPPFRPKGQRAPPIPRGGFRRGCRRRAASLASFVISAGDNGDTGDNGGFLRVWRCPRWFRGTGDTGDRLGGLGSAPCAPPCQEPGGAGHT